jgi:hypothetical protein
MTGGRRGSEKNVHSEPSGSRFEMKCRSSNTINDPSSIVGSTTPHAVHPITAIAPSSFSAQIFARCVTRFDNRTWPAPCRETCRASTPA